MVQNIKLVQAISIRTLMTDYRALSGLNVRWDIIVTLFMTANWAHHGSET
jgi:hypothetical protein